MKLKKRFAGFMSIILLLAAGTITAYGDEGFTGVVSIVHINDVHTYVAESETAIGYPKIAAFFDLMRQENPNTIILDAGDTFSGTALGAFDQGTSIVPILNTMNIDAMAAGNADFAVGVEQLNTLAGSLEYPVLCGNMDYKNGASVLDGYTIITLDNGMQAGIFSVTAPDSVRGLSDELDYIDPIERAQSLVNKLVPQTDFIIALVHLGDSESYAYTSMDIANRVQGIDIIIDGHSHTVLPEGRTENGVLIAQAGEYSKYIGVVDLEFNNGTIVSSKAQLISKENMPTLEEKPSTAAALQSSEEKSGAYFAQVIGETLVDLDGERNTIRTQETAVGNMFADAVRSYGQTDAAMIVAGVVGGEMNAGVLTKGDVLTIVRVDQDIAVIEITGDHLVALLNNQVRAYPEPNASFPQVSGLSFSFDPDQESERVFDVMVDVQPLDRQRTYTLAMLSSNAADAEGTIIKELGSAQYIVEQYIMENSPVTPQIEGRITPGVKPASENNAKTAIGASEIAAPLQPPSEETTYVVLPGDTLWAISRIYGLSYQEIAAYNNIPNPNLIYPNQVIYIP